MIPKTKRKKRPPSVVTTKDGIILLAATVPSSKPHYVFCWSIQKRSAA